MIRLPGMIRRPLALLVAGLAVLTLGALALETELATAADWRGNEVSLSSDVKANQYVLYFSDEYGVNSNLQRLSPGQMKQFRLAYKEAKRQVAVLPPKTEGLLFSKKFGFTTFSFLGAQPGGTRMILLMVTNSADVDKNTFAIPVRWSPKDNLADDYKANVRTWETLLNYTNH